MTEKELAVCDECGSLFFKDSSQMMGLCPECAHVLYGYPNCDHHFQDGRCVNCYWDGSKSLYIKKQNQQEETNMPTTEWLNKYEAIKDKLTCKDDLETHFTEKVIGNMGVDVLDIGTVYFPTGTIFACDPLVELEDTPPFIQTIPAGTYPVKICVVPSEKYGDRYACVKVEVSREKPVRYELGMTGKEDLDEEPGEDEYFGFGVDAGMGCVADIQTQALDAVAAYTQTFNKMGFIETEERDEIYMALRGILDALPGDTLQKDFLIEKFEELRDF